MRFIIIACLLLFFSLTGYSATIGVPADHATIQAAITAAANGDTVRVESGTYIENIDFLGKDIHLCSTNDPEATVIDGNNGASVVIFQSGETCDAVIEGFTLTNGHASSLPGGGGILCRNGSGPTIRGNIITRNDVGGAFGGGLYCNGSSPKVIGNRITENTSDHGGGICCREGSAPYIFNNLIKDNSSFEDGGGIECGSGSKPLIKDNLIIGNYTSYNWSYGGGIYCGTSASAMIIRNRILDNQAAHSGGGIYDDNASPKIYNNTLMWNTAQTHYGGGIASNNNSSAVISGNLIARNHANLDGGGIYTWYTDVTTITNCSIINNTSGSLGGGICCGALCYDLVTNSILWGNNAPTGSQIFVGFSSSSGTCTVNYCDIEFGLDGVVNSGGVFNWGDNMYTIDPEFVDEAGDDYHLVFDSPVRDIGDSLAPSLDQNDFEGDARDAYGAVDFGADEFFPHLYVIGEPAPGGDIQVKAIASPGQPVILFLGFGALDTPLQTPYGNWYLNFPVLTILQANTSAQGILALSATIPSDCPAPCVVPLQAVIQKDLTNLCLLKIFD